MDYVCAGYPQHKIPQDFPQITDEQFDLAISFIRENRELVEAEYQVVIQTDEETRQYWENRNQKRLAEIVAQPVDSQQVLLRAKLADWKTQIMSETTE